MANNIRSAKSASRWAASDLAAYNIQVVEVHFRDFLGVENLPASRVSRTILAYRDYPAVRMSESVNTFFRLLEDVMVQNSREAAVDNLAAHVLELTGYRRNDRVIKTREHIRLLVCGMFCDATPDVCVIDGQSKINLLVQEDKRYRRSTCSAAEPQLIAEAIAAFQDRNRRLSAAGLPLVNAAVLPGIVMIGSAPFFYKIQVTRALAGAVERGQYPVHTTYVHRMSPPVGNQGNIYNDGMLPLENRSIIFSCYEAFRRFV